MLYMVTRGLAFGGDDNDIDIIGIASDRKDAEKMAAHYQGTTDMWDKNGATITEYADLSKSDIPDKILFECETSEYDLKKDDPHCNVSPTDEEYDFTTCLYYFKYNVYKERKDTPNRHWRGTVLAKDGYEAKTIFLAEIQKWKKEHVNNMED